MNILITILTVLVFIGLISMIFVCNTIFRMINNTNRNIDVVDERLNELSVFIKKVIYEGNIKLDELSKNNSIIEEIGNTLDKITLTNINYVDKKLDNINKFLTNLQLDINNKHDYICDNKLNRIILNTNTVKECVELISNNTNKLVKSLEANNSYTQHKTYKSSTKKKKEEKEANNS